METSKDVSLHDFILETLFKLVIVITIPCLFVVRFNVDVISFPFNVVFIPWP